MGPAASCPLPVTLLTCFRKLIMLRQTKQSAGHGPLSAQMPQCWAARDDGKNRKGVWREGREYSVLHFGIIEFKVNVMPVLVDTYTANTKVAVKPDIKNIIKTKQQKNVQAIT